MLASDTVLGCSLSNKKVLDTAISEDNVDTIPPVLLYPPLPSPSPSPSPQPFSPMPAAPDPVSGLDYKTKRKLRRRAQNKKARKAKMARDDYRTPVRKVKRMRRKHYNLAKQVVINITLEELPMLNATFGRFCSSADNPIIVEREPEETGTILVDLKHRIFAARVMPSGHIPPNLPENMVAAIHKLNAKFNAQEPINKSRKSYGSVSFGISHGAGQAKPSWLKGENSEPVEEFMADPNVRVYVHHVTNIFDTWWPDLLHHYQENIILLEEHEGLQRPFKRCPFVTFTANLGPQAVTKRRKDYRNVPYGLCAILILGSYNHKTSGRLQLEELNVELEVAPGDIVFFPACIYHSISAITQEETIYSLTFSASGQLFHWAHNHYHPTKTLTAAEQEGDADNGGLQSVKTGWDLYRTTKEFEIDDSADHLGENLPMEQIGILS